MNKLCLVGRRTRETTADSGSPSMDHSAITKHEGSNMHGERDGVHDRLFHFSHPHHPLVRVTLPYLFTCMGCREYGAGRRFTCHRCCFDLHEFCAMAPPSLLGHPFGNEHHLAFMTKSGGFLRSTCDICEKPAKGYTFRCTDCSFEMHPGCSLLLSEMRFPTHPHPLTISTASAADQYSTTSGSCRMCVRRRSGCVYHCTTCDDYSLHAVCAKDMVNGLHANGIHPPEKTNRLGKAFRAASHAFLGFLGGLIEGIGEGIGDALIDGLGRSRNNRSSLRRNRALLNV